jgi:hypothetical protein
MEITKEYFDQQLEGLNKRIDGFGTRMDSLATKQDVKDAIEDLARDLLRPTFERIETKLDATARVAKLETDLKQLKEALALH